MRLVRFFAVALCTFCALGTHQDCLAQAIDQQKQEVFLHRWLKATSTIRSVEVEFMQEILTTGRSSRKQIISGRFRSDGVSEAVMSTQRFTDRDEDYLLQLYWTPHDLTDSSWRGAIFEQFKSTINNSFSVPYQLNRFPVMVNLDANELKKFAKPKLVRADLVQSTISFRPDPQVEPELTSTPTSLGIIQQFVKEQTTNPFSHTEISEVLITVDNATLLPTVHEMRYKKGNKSTFKISKVVYVDDKK